MPVTFMDGFEIYQAVSEMALRPGPQYWQPGNGVSLAAGRVAGQAARIADGGTLGLAFRADVPSGGDDYGRDLCILQFAAFIEAGCEFKVALLIDSLLQITFRFGADGMVKPTWNTEPGYQQPTTFTVAAAYRVGQWFYCRLGWNVVHKQGAPFASCQVSLDNWPFASADPNAICAGYGYPAHAADGRSINRVSFSAAGGAALIDDFVVAQGGGTGDYDNYFEHPYRVVALTPTGALSTGVSVAGTESLTAFGPFSPSAAETPIVQVTAAYQATEGGHTVNQAVRTGTARAGAAASPAAGFSICESVFLTDPTTGLHWEPARLAPGAVLAGWRLDDGTVAD